MTQRERDEAMNHPLVRQVVDLFDARLVDLRERPEDDPEPDHRDTYDHPDHN